MTIKSATVNREKKEAAILIEIDERSLNMENKEDCEFKIWKDADIEKAIRYGIELSQTGKVKEGFPPHIVDQIVKTATKKFIDNMENK